MNFHCANEQDIHYRDSVTFQGVKLCNQQSKKNTIWVRGHSYLQVSESPLIMPTQETIAIAT